MEQEKSKRAPLQNAVTVIGILVSVAVIVLAGLQLADVWTGAVNLLVPLLGLNLLCQAYTQWNAHRKTAYFSLGVAIFIFVCSIVVFLLP